MYLIPLGAILRLSQRAYSPNPHVLEGLFVVLRLLDFLLLSMLSRKIHGKLCLILLSCSFYR